MAHAHPPVGAQQHFQQCTFTVWAPEKKLVELLLGSNEKGLPMVADQKGYWKVTADNVLPGEPYQFRIDGIAVPDPASMSQPDGVHGKSKVTDRNFNWTDKGWKGLTISEMIQYELHVGTFSENGTFDGIVGKLDYLVELGINTIELMPVAQFPGKKNWGYDGVFPFAVHNSYGTPADLKNLVNRSHEKGIAVVLDVVYNHLGPEGNYFENFAPYFTDTYKTGWGKALNFDGPFSDGVRNYYFRNAVMWLDEFHIDGLRLDAVHAIYDYGAHHFIQALQEKVTEVALRTGSEKILIAEIDLNNPRYINPVEKGGFGLAGQWADEFHHALHSLTTGECNGYYEDFGKQADLVKAMKDSYVYTGQYSKHRKKYFGVHPKANPYSQFVVFGQNHDQIGNRMAGDRISTLLNFEQLKLYASTVLLTAQTPLLFMGEEYGERRPFQYFADHSDPDLLKAVREGRKNEFRHFNWQGEVPDPFADRTYEACKLSWDIKAKSNSSLLSVYKFLIRFRKERKALRGKNEENVQIIENPGNKLVIVRRTTDADTVFLFFNFRSHAVQFQNKLADLNRIFDSSGEIWGGFSSSGIQNIATGESMTLSPYSLNIFALTGS